MGGFNYEITKKMKKKNLTLHNNNFKTLWYFNI